jgi:hypothetical protein
LAVQGHLLGGALVLGMAQFGGLVRRGGDGLAEGGELGGLSRVVLSRGGGLVLQIDRVCAEGVSGQARREGTTDLL